MSDHSHICRFSSADHLRGKMRTYESVRAAVLKAGRYSVCEATETPASAALFEKLDRDPMLERFEMSYPWIGVRLRSSPNPLLETLHRKEGK